MQLILFSIIALACVTAFPYNKTITENLEDQVQTFYKALNNSNSSLAASLNQTSACPCNVFNAYALDQIPIFTQEFIGCQGPNSTIVDECIVEKLCKPLKGLAENPCGGFFNNTIHVHFPQKAQLISSLLEECAKLMGVVIKINDTCTANNVEDYTVFAVNNTASDANASLVQYHVIKGAFTVSNMFQKNFLESVYENENRTQYVEVIVVGAGTATTVRVVTDFVARTFANVTASFAGSNGFVHIIQSPMSLPKPPSEVLTNMSATLSNLTAAVVREKLESTLDGMKVLTLLAPVDSGFANFPFYSNLTDGLQVLTLQSHIVTSPTPVFSTDVLQLNGDIINTSSGLELKIQVDGERVGFVSTKDASDVTYVVMADVVTSNGVIHVVDSVLRPLIDTASNSVADNLFLDERLTDFASLVVSAPDFLKKLQNMTNATLFAPQNLTAVAMLGISEIEALLEYHTLDREILSSQLKMGQNVATTTLADKEYVRLDGAPQIMIVEASNSSVTLHSTYATKDVNVTFPNLVSAHNVVIHVVSSPLQVPIDTISTLRAGGYGFLASSFANNTELAKMVNGLPNGFNTSSSMFTIFAASDKAYSSLSSEANETALSVMQDQILAGRVLSGELAAYLAANNDSVVITMVSGRVVTVELKDGEIYVGGWKVLEADVLTANGVVHVIEGAVGTSPSSSSGLSAGVLAAIIVGGVAFLGLLCYCFFMKGEDGSSEETQPFARIP